MRQQRAQVGRHVHVPRAQEGKQVRGPGVARSAIAMEFLTGEDAEAAVPLWANRGGAGEAGDAVHLAEEGPGRDGAELTGDAPGARRAHLALIEAEE